MGWSAAGLKRFIARLAACRGEAQRTGMGEWEMESWRAAILEGGSTWIAPDVRISGRDFDIERYVSELGEPVRGWTAALWISLPDELTGGWRQSHVRVRPGQQIQLERYLLEVIEIQRDDSRGLIRVSVARRRAVCR